MENVNLNIKGKIEESIATQKPLIFTYKKLNEYISEEHRVVFREMYSKTGHFYAVGYCLKRKGKRTFRLNRIEEIKGLGSLDEAIPFFTPETPSDSIPVEEEIKKITTETKN